MKLFSHLFVNIPDEHHELFHQHRELHNANRLYILAFINIAVHLLLYIVDGVRYVKNDLFSNPTSTGIFYWHLLTTLFLPFFILLILRIKVIRASKYAYTGRLLSVLIFIFAVNLSVRGIFGVLDRGSLTFFISMQYLISLLVVLPLWHRTFFVALPSFCVLFCILFLKTETSSTTHIVAYCMEVVVNGVLSFVLSSILYWYFQERFLSKRHLETQNAALNTQQTTLQAQQIALQAQHDTLATLHQNEAAMNAQLLTQQQALVIKTDTQSRQITTFALQMTKHNQTLQELVTQLQELNEQLPATHKTVVNRLIRQSQNNISSGDDWARFKVFFEETHPNFFAYLHANYPDLSSHDTRLLALLALQLNTKDIAALLAISANSVNTARYRLRRRLTLDTDTDLSAFAQQLTQHSAPNSI